MIDEDFIFIFSLPCMYHQWLQPDPRVMGSRPLREKLQLPPPPPLWWALHSAVARWVWREVYTRGSSELGKRKLAYHILEATTTSQKGLGDSDACGRQEWSMPQMS